jgi:hypothetical protein
MSRIKHLLHTQTDFSEILNLLEATDAAMAELGSTLMAISKAIDELVELHDDFMTGAFGPSTPTQAAAFRDECF